MNNGQQIFIQQKIGLDGMLPNNFL